jgi:hypothetical protein
MLWVLKKDGHHVTKRNAIGAVIYGLSLAAIVNVLNYLVDVTAVGIIAGGIGMGLLYSAQRFGLLGKSNDSGEKMPEMTNEQRSRFYKAVAPLVIVSILASIWGSFGKPIESALGVIQIPVVADQSVPFKVMQPLVWPAVTVLIMFTWLKPSKESWAYVGRMMRERWLINQIATMMFAGMVFTYFWSGKTIIDGHLVLLPGNEHLNLLNILANATVGGGLLPYMILVPFMSMFATTLLGTELTSTTFFTPFHFIAAKILGFTKPTVFMVGHIVANIGITDIRKLMKNVALIGAYGEEYKSLRTTFVIGLIITALTIIPLLSFLFWP